MGARGGDHVIRKPYELRKISLCRETGTAGNTVTTRFSIFREDLRLGMIWLI